MKDIDCPYCGHGFDICNDDGHGLDESQTYQETCPSCEKVFVFTSSISVNYSAEKADCLNGAEHDFKLTATYPKEFAKMRCTVCEEKATP